jgi:hypothetical protein
MKIPQDLLAVARDFKTVKKDPVYSDYLKDYLIKSKNPWFFYKRIEAKKNEILCSLHNHSDGGNYDLEDLAFMAAIRGYKIFGVTNHRRDYQFEGNSILYNRDFDVFLVRGMECRCEEELENKKKRKFFSLRKLRQSSKDERGEENDILLLGYKDNIRDFKPLKETLNKAKQQEALIILTSFANRAFKGPSYERALEIKPYTDAMEISDSNLVSQATAYEIMAAKFAKDNNIPGIVANDAHTLREIGCSGIGFPEEDYDFLDDINPKLKEEKTKYVVNNPQILIEALRNSFKTRRYNNYWNHIPKLSFIYPDKILSLFRDAVLRPFDNNIGDWIAKEN